MAYGRIHCSVAQSLSIGLSLLPLTLAAWSGEALAASGSRSAARLDKGAVVAAHPEANTPLIAIVSIGEQRVTIWSGDAQIARASVSTGMAGHRTPTGIFSVIGKERYHESNLYSNAPMPFMQRITWSGIALHAGALPGYPASHGCIRLPEDFAQRLFGMTRVGMRVIVADHDMSPTPVAHMALPAPTFIQEERLADAGNERLDGARMRLGGPGESGGRLLNPIERGKREQGRAKVAALQAQADAQALLEIAAARGADARAAAAIAQSAEAALASISQSRAQALAVAIDTITSDEERANAAAHRDSLERDFQAAVQRAEAARTEKDERETSAFQAAAEAKAAVAERDEMEHTARVAERATEPVSVFVSRKERRVFVRQGFEPVFEADVEILDPEQPLGTHVFTATAPPVETGAMQWVVLSVHGTTREDESRPVRANRSVASAPSAATPMPATAARALDRVKFSDEVLQRISEKLWVGASLIISDHGISGETGKGTDFVVLTR